VLSSASQSNWFLQRTLRPQSWNDYGLNFPPVRCLLDFFRHVLTSFSLMSSYWKMNLRQKHSSMIRTNVFLFTQTRAVGLGGCGESPKYAIYPSTCACAYFYCMEDLSQASPSSLSNSLKQNSTYWAIVYLERFHPQSILTHPYLALLNTITITIRCKHACKFFTLYHITQSIYSNSRSQQL